jgi:hypothetical protein
MLRLFNVMLSVGMLSIFKMNVVMLSVVIYTLGK